MTTDLASTSAANIWTLRESLENVVEMELVYKEGLTLALNASELESALHEFIRCKDYPLDWAYMPLTPDFPRPKLQMPRGFAPDFFSYGPRTFASAKLRAALAQPESVVQYIAAELIDSPEQAHAQQYCWMRVLASQPCMDLGRSQYTRTESTGVVTGRKFDWLDNVTRLFLVPDFQPATEIFHVAELPAWPPMVTDALAQRLLQAGCTGLELIDPETSYPHWQHFQRSRDLGGVRTMTFDEIVQHIKELERFVRRRRRRR